jgi:DNA-binding NarL/FixJ family response regulator
MSGSILIVDDHAAFRFAMRAVLDREGFEVVGEASDGETGIREARRLRPDIALIDIQLPDIDGFAVAARLAEGGHAPVMILISTREASAYGGRVAAASVAGFLAKRSISGAAIRAVVERTQEP